MIINFQPYNMRWPDRMDNYIYISAFDHNNSYFADYDSTNNKLLPNNVNNSVEFNKILKQYNIPILEK